MNVTAAVMLLVLAQGCNVEQPEIINNGIKMKGIDIKAKIRQALESCNWAKAQELIAQAEPDIEIINMTEAALRKLQVQRAENLMSMALLQQVQLKYTKAADYWEKAAEALPDDMVGGRGEFRAKRDKALVDQKELDRSRVATETGMSAAEAARHLGALLSLTDNNAAIESYKKSISLDPNHQGAWRMLEILLEKTGDKGGAVYAASQAKRCAQEEPK